MIVIDNSIIPDKWTPGAGIIEQDRQDGVQ